MDVPEVERNIFNDVVTFTPEVSPDILSTLQSRSKYIADRMTIDTRINEFLSADNFSSLGFLMEQYKRVDPDSDILTIDQQFYDPTDKYDTATKRLKREMLTRAGGQTDPLAMTNYALYKMGLPELPQNSYTGNDLALYLMKMYRTKLLGASVPPGLEPFEMQLIVDQRNNRFQGFFGIEQEYYLQERDVFRNLTRNAVSKGRLTSTFKGKVQQPEVAFAEAVTKAGSFYQIYPKEDSDGWRFTGRAASFMPVLYRSRANEILGISNASEHPVINNRVLDYFLDCVDFDLGIDMLTSGVKVQLDPKLIRQRVREIKRIYVDALQDPQFDDQNNFLNQRERVINDLISAVNQGRNGDTNPVIFSDLDIAALRVVVNFMHANASAIITTMQRYSKQYDRDLSENIISLFNTTLEVAIQAA